MGIHKRQRELDEFKQHYMKKSSCILFVCIALLAGVFIGNTVTVLYLGQQQARQSVGSSSQGAPVAQEGQHTANPAALARLENDAAANPTNAGAWIKLGNFCFDHDMPEKAIVAYERAVELTPMDINVWSDLGVMYRRTGKFDQAIDAFSHAASLDPSHVTSRFNMGIVYLHDMNDRQSALEAWKEVLSINPEAVSPTGQKVADLVSDLQ